VGHFAHLRPSRLETRRCRCAFQVNHLVQVIAAGQVPQMRHLARARGTAMARTGKRKAGGLARLSRQYAKRLARSQAKTRRKTEQTSDLPWWARPRTPGQR
jgi:hypothetical protein